MELSQVTLGAVLPEEEARFRAVMGTHHYLGAAPKVGETLWYGALWRGEWVALASFSAAALKCQARDAWIGWTLRHKYDRLHLVANNTRFLLLRPVPNLGSRVLGLCARHLVRDWPARFHHPLVLLETFVDPSRFVGTVYRAAGWTELGMTRGFRRVRGGYRAGSTPKKVFVRALTRHARRVLCTPTLEPRYRHGRPRTMLSAEQMRSLPDVFRTITDPRSRYGRRYRLETLLGLAAAATLCGARGYKAIHEWVCDLSPAMLRHFRCRRVNGAYERPSIYCLRNAIVKVAPEELDAALRAWFSAHGHDDASLAIDGKTMKGAVDEAGRQVHILGACGHETAIAWGQKKTVLTGDDGSAKRTNEIGVAIPLLDQLGDLAGKTRHRRCPADTDRDRLLPAQARRPLHVRGQGQPEDSAQRHPAMVPRRRKTPSPTLPTRPASPSTASCRPRTDAGNSAKSGPPPRSTTISCSPASGRPSSFAAPAAKCARAGSPTPRSTPPGA